MKKESKILKMKVSLPLSLSIDSIVFTSRTTICDLMSITNTNKIIQTEPEVSNTRKMKAFATLPYNNNLRQPLPQGSTFLSKYHNAEIKKIKSDELKEERRIFLKKLELERLQKKKNENNAIIKIQAIVRGFLIRPRIKERSRKIIYQPIKLFSSTSNEVRKLQDELCLYALQLNLKPIPGLSLEARSKHNKRKNQIEYAASLRIQSFFRMIIAILKVRRAALSARARLIHNSAVRLQKFFHYIMWLVKRCKKRDESREIAAVKIQKRYRMFRSFHL